jgi:isoquinoline 1-oxidoreductase beta subunit
VSGAGRLSRRSFIKGSVVAGAGFTLALDLREHARRAGAATEPFTPNAWIRITPDNRVTIIVDKSDMGQGVLTSMPMLIAEELEADWSTITVETAPAHPKYGNPALGGLQLTGGSLSVRTSWLRFRTAGAAAKEMLVEAAAREWGVPPETCVAENSTVAHPPTGRRLTYGELTDRAARLPVPADPRLKSPKDFKLIGKRVKRLENPPKMDGRAVYGIDVQVAELLVATVARCPVFGGKVRTFDPTAAKAIPGVRHVVQIDSGIAVVADGYWPAKLGRDALVIEWDEGPNALLSSAAIRKLFEEASTQPGPVARNQGDALGALEGAAIRLDAIYEVPYLHHATMEPMTCTAHVRPDGCDVWVGTQWQDGTQNTAAKVANLSPGSVRVHTLLLGGGFGRRFEQDFVAETVAIAKAVRAPVKLIWSREDDTRHGFYRPTTLNRLSGGLGADGMPIAWTHRIIGTSIAARAFPAFIQDGIDGTAIEGAANIPYAIPNVRVESIMKETGIPVGFWRSVGSSQNAYITECFLDELAAAGQNDPYELRRKLLPATSRHRGVLDLAAKKAGWGTPLPPGRGRGLAVAESFGSWVAQVAEVSVSPAGEVRVHRVVCALDCGIVVNPDTVEAQIEGAVAFGLTAALRGEITIDRGRVQQSNFHDYPMLRINEMPAVEVHILPSTEPPGGVGEPGVPPVAPAVVNAIFAATGRHLRSLPISKHDLKRA